MRLYLVDKPNCQFMKDRIPGISIVYQMEQEFRPYLLVDFLPNHGNITDPNLKNGGVIIMAGKEVIKKPLTFDNKSDESELRNILWNLLEKYHPNIHNKWPTSMVVDNWTDAKKAYRVGCNIGPTIMNDDVMVNMRYDPKIIKTAAQELANFYTKHWSLRDDFSGPKNYKQCFKARIQECTNNFPKNSEQYRICHDEIVTLCNMGYNTNNLQKQNDYVEFVQSKLYKKLQDNGFKVDKQLFDDIIDAGMLAEPDRRRLVKRSLIDVENYFVDKINKKINKREEKSNYKLYLLILLLVIGVIVYKKFNN